MPLGRLAAEDAVGFFPGEEAERGSLVAGFIGFASAVAKVVVGRGA